jgi:hypothetical protein
MQNKWWLPGCILCLFSIYTFGQSNAVTTTNPAFPYAMMVGDIAFDPVVDKKDFQICNPEYIFQYFNNTEGFSYEGEKPAIERIFADQYKLKRAKKESGLVRIRFVVNCKGETDRFRVIGMDKDYNEKVFDPSITDQLLTITKALKGWKPKQYEGQDMDFYQYLIFKLEQGRIVEILP